MLFDYECLAVLWVRLREPDLGVFEFCCLSLVYLFGGVCLIYFDGL